MHFHLIFLCLYHALIYYTIQDKHKCAIYRNTKFSGELSQEKFVKPNVTNKYRNVKCYVVCYEVVYIMLVHFFSIFAITYKEPSNALHALFTFDFACYASGIKLKTQSLILKVGSDFNVRISTPNNLVSSHSFFRIIFRQIGWSKNCKTVCEIYCTISQKNAFFGKHFAHIFTQEKSHNEVYCDHIIFYFFYLLKLTHLKNQFLYI